MVTQKTKKIQYLLEKTKNELKLRNYSRKTIKSYLHCLKDYFSFKKVNRRINGLKNMIIPRLTMNIKQIREILEEIERENYVRLKKTKDLIISKEKTI